MPISFEQAGPYAPGISQAAGQAQGIQQMLPAVLQGLQNQNNAYLQGYQIQGHDNQQALENSRYIDPVSLYMAKSGIDEAARNREQAAQEKAIYDYYGQPGQGGGQQNQDDPARQNRILELMRQRAQAAGGINQQPLDTGGPNPPNQQLPGSDRDGREQQPGQQPIAVEWGRGQEQELAGLLNSQTAVNRQLRNGEIDPGTARRAIMMLRTHIDPLRLEQQQAQTQIAQQQAQQMEQQARTQARLETERRQALAQADPRGWVWQDLPDGTRIPMTWNDREGGLVVVPHYMQWMENQRHHQETESARRDQTTAQREAREARQADQTRQAAGIWQHVAGEMRDEVKAMDAEIGRQRQQHTREHPAGSPQSVFEEPTRPGWHHHDQDREAEHLRRVNRQLIMLGLNPLTAPPAPAQSQSSGAPAATVQAQQEAFNRLVQSGLLAPVPGRPANPERPIPTPRGLPLGPGQYAPQPAPATNSAADMMM